MNHYNADMLLAESVYDTLLGDLIPEYALSWVEEIFVPGHPCHEAYCRMRGAYQRVCLRLRTTEEDADLDEMVDSLLEHGRVLALEMFCYGRTYEKMQNGG